jgi:hypothetical protein
MGPFSPKTKTGETKESPLNILSSILRTIVPIVVGAVLTFLVKHNVLDPDTTAEAEQLTLVLNAVVTGAYYVVVRFLETKVAPSFGWLLGLAKQPGYEPGPAPAPPPTPN